MKLVCQRVKTAKVVVNGHISGEIGPGVLAFLGIHKNDTPEKTSWLVNKLVHLRLFEDEWGKMNRSVKEIDGEILVVSQFTLYANCANGRRPDFFAAAPPAQAKPIYEKFVSEVKKELGQVQTGVFGASMEVYSVNNGPVTLILEEKSSGGASH
ncbi:MAG: D-aminoacyl-tRNA deacylase [Waddliaceae bacterium]